MRGLIAILFALFSGKPARDILAADAIALFERLGLREHLTPQRSNGFRSMVERIRSDARTALAALGIFGSARRSAIRPPARRFDARGERIDSAAGGRCWPSPICLARCERAAA